MKILHISDLHLGHNFHTYDRTKEQESCLRQIESIIRDRQPDAYVVSGDIYHTTSPQTGAQEMLIRHLMNAHTLAPDMRIVVTAGNHDSNKITEYIKNNVTRWADDCYNTNDCYNK